MRPGGRTWPGLTPSNWEIVWTAAGRKAVPWTGVAFVVLVSASSWDVTVIYDIGKSRDQDEVTTAAGKDKSGKSARYEIILVSGEYFWKYGSTVSVVNSEAQEVPIEQKLASNGIATLVNRSTDIIAVGTASCIGSGEEEESRAYDRARNLVAGRFRWPKQSSICIS